MYFDSKFTSNIYLRCSYHNTILSGIATQKGEIRNTLVPLKRWNVKFQGNSDFTFIRIFQVPSDFNFFCGYKMFTTLNFWMDLWPIRFHLCKCHRDLYYTLWIHSLVKSDVPSIHSKGFLQLKECLWSAHRTEI